MKLRTLMIVGLFLLTAQFAGAQDVPTWTAGDWYEMSEFYYITTPLIGDNGFLEGNATTRYEVIGTETITLDKAPGASYDCYKIEFSGELTGTGYVSLTNPIPLEGNVRLGDGSISGTEWLRVSDLKTVKKNRLLRAFAEAEIVPGTWLPLDWMIVDQWEEYEAPLTEFQFPLADGNTWNDALTIYLYGDFTMPYMGTDSFDTSVAWTYDGEVKGMVDKTTAQGTCSTYHCEVMTNTGTKMTDYYCPDAGWFIDQSLENVALGSEATIEQANRTVIDYQFSGVTADTPTPTPTTGVDTPTPTPTPTQGTGDLPPSIALAGYMSTDISAASGGHLTLMAYCMSASGADITKVDILVQGQPAGTTLPSTGTPGLFQLDLDLPGGLSPMDLLLELQATDSNGMQSDLWPYMVVRPGTAPAPSNWNREFYYTPIDWSTEYMLELMASERTYRPSQGGPYVALGGYWDSAIYAGSDTTMTLLAYVMGTGIEAVELYFNKQPTGVTLFDDGQHGDFSAGDGIWGFQLPLTAGSLTPMNVLLEVQARTSGGQTSDIWPWLVIH